MEPTGWKNNNISLEGHMVQPKTSKDINAYSGSVTPTKHDFGG
jgi:hypothetical protein